MSGTTIEAGGGTQEWVPVATLVAVETASTHAGTPGASFTFIYNGATLSFMNGVPFIADAGLYAAMNASGVSVSWSS